jgi:hypothetical protein
LLLFQVFSCFVTDSNARNRIYIYIYIYIYMKSNCLWHWQPGFNSRYGHHFYISKISRPALRPNHSPVQWLSRLFSFCIMLLLRVFKANLFPCSNLWLYGVYWRGDGVSGTENWLGRHKKYYSMCGTSRATNRFLFCGVLVKVFIHLLGPKLVQSHEPCMHTTNFSSSELYLLNNSK